MPRPNSGLSGRTKILLAASLAVLSAASAHRLFFAPLPGPLFEFSGETMGTTYLVKVSAPEMSRDARAEVEAAIAARLARVTAAMSTWAPDSELSRFNRHAANVPFPASAELLEVFLASREVSERSHGAFDITVAPLVAAWGFGAGARVQGGPDADELEVLRSRIGFRRIEIDAEGGNLAKDSALVTCDLSAIAKGFGVDLVAMDVAALGWSNYLVEVGGELRAGGTRPDGGPWRVAVETPTQESSDDRAVYEVVALRDVGMATSGDYRNFYEEGGVRVSHTIDPRTGRPIRHALASVTVLHPQAMYADGYATALNVLGPEEGFALASELELAAYFILRAEDGTLTSLETPQFAVVREAGRVRETGRAREAGREQG